MRPSADLPLLDFMIAPYLVARLTAVIACVVLTTVLNRRQGITAWATLATSVVCVPVAILGAQVLDMVEYGTWYPSVAAALARNGSSIYGAFLATFPVVAVAMWLWRVPPLRFLDGAAPALALGEAITRIGCFCAGCCYGVPWDGPWAVTFPRGSFAFQDLRAQGLLAATMTRTMPLHPVQLYATATMLLVTLGLIWRFGRRGFEGEIFALFLIAYGSERLVLAPFRMEALASMKVFSVLFIVAGCGFLTQGLRTVRITAGTRGCTPRPT